MDTLLVVNVIKELGAEVKEGTSKEDTARVVGEFVRSWRKGGMKKRRVVETGVEEEMEVDAAEEGKGEGMEVDS